MSNPEIPISTNDSASLDCTCDGARRCNFEGLRNAVSPTVRISNDESFLVPDAGFLALRRPAAALLLFPSQCHLKVIGYFGVQPQLRISMLIVKELSDHGDITVEVN
jgi:hypothetical protein